MRLTEFYSSLDRTKLIIAFLAAAAAFAVSSPGNVEAGAARSFKKWSSLKSSGQTDIKYTFGGETRKLRVQIPSGKGPFPIVFNLHASATSAPLGNVAVADVFTSYYEGDNGTPAFIAVVPESLQDTKNKNYMWNHAPIDGVTEIRVELDADDFGFIDDIINQLETNDDSKDKVGDGRYFFGHSSGANMAIALSQSRSYVTGAGFSGGTFHKDSAYAKSSSFSDSQYGRSSQWSYDALDSFSSSAGKPRLVQFQGGCDDKVPFNGNLAGDKKGDGQLDSDCSNSETLGMPLYPVAEAARLWGEHNAGTSFELATGVEKTVDIPGAAMTNVVVYSYLCPATVNDAIVVKFPGEKHVSNLIKKTATGVWLNMLVGNENDIVAAAAAASK